MTRRLAALLLALVAVLGVSVSAPQPAAADGIVGSGIGAACRIGTAPVLGSILGLKGKTSDSAALCDVAGEVVDKKVKEAWKGVWDSLLGDIITSAVDVAKWVIRTVLTVALLGPSVDLAGTGLWGKGATLSGMLMWLGLVIAAAGMMWQLGKMAITGEVKHAGRAMRGWVENMILSTVGVSLFVLMLVVGDALSAGLINATFSAEGAYDRIIQVLIPAGIANPITLLGVVQILLIVGFIQLIMIFLRYSAIPIICLLLPVAGGGRAGGDATREWAPRLITSGLVIVAYKPILTIIICTGFAEFGEAKTLIEWLRGVATLVLGVLAPGPLTKIFAPFGAAVGAGMAAGGASGALSAAAGYVGGRAGGDEGESDGGVDDGSSDAVKHAQYVKQSMGSQGGGGDEGGAIGDAQAQAARNEAGRVPAQAAEGEAVGASALGGEAAAGAAGAAGAGGSAAAAGGPAGVAVAAGIQVLDGVNDTIQGAAGEMGGGDR
ncbi:hypothetical protein ABT394_29915 [Streptomyces halstedii]